MNKPTKYHVHTSPNGKLYLIKTGPRGSRRNMGEVDDSDHALRVVTKWHNAKLASRPQQFDLSAQHQQELF